MRGDINTLQKERDTMPHFIREKKIDCGNHYREVDIYPFFETPEQQQKRRGKRSKKIKESEPKQKNLNDKNAKRYFAQLANMNFGAETNALHVTITYKDEFLPSTIEEAEKEAYNYLRRIGHKRKKAGLPPLKYMLVTEYNEDVDSHSPTRIHHHLLMNGDLDRDEVENLWRRKRKKGELEGERIGFANADRLQANDDGITALCTYLCKQRKKKKWSSSKNLDRPHSRTNDTTYRKKQIEQLAKDRPTKEFWEKQYPGWTITSQDYGVTYEFNEVTASWSIYLKLRKKNNS